MTNLLHLFNPGYETAVLLGNVSYTPPVNVRKMQYDLALLPLWYAGQGDFVLTDDEANMAFTFTLPQEIRPKALPVTPAGLTRHTQPALTAYPWGVSYQSLRYFEEIRDRYRINMIVPEWKSEYRDLTGRETAAECLEMLHELLQGYPLPPTPLFCKKVEDVTDFIRRNHPPFVLKTPYSSSGRGLLWIYEQSLSEKDKEWIKGALQKQGTLSVEKGLDKMQDFALEFYIDKDGRSHYKGLSVFNTAEKGSYTGNKLKRQEQLREEISSVVGEEEFSLVISATEKLLERFFGKYYSGYIGVDMMTYMHELGSILIHPCVEINMRLTMGMVAVKLFEDYVDPSVEGVFNVSFEPDAYKLHLQMQEEHPLEITGGKITKGYLSLCPVTSHTCYRAYILIS